MTVSRLLLAAALSLATAAGASAATIGRGYTGFAAFGDSLTDPGNLFAATGDSFPPSPPYFDGRFSNGPTWAEDVAARFTKAGLNSANFAFGGANAVPDGTDGVPDLPLQLSLFGATVPIGVLGAKPLAALWFGANDIFNQLDKPASTLEEAVAVAKAAADAVAKGAADLARIGFADILLFNLPDLGSIPRFALFDPADAPKATAAAAAFNSQLDSNIALLRGAGQKVIAVDVDSLFTALIDDPTQFGLTDATQPCFVPGVRLCTPLEAEDWAFFDQSHPNFVVHRVIGDTVTAALVPLPASVLMLGAGLAGLGLLRRRRTA